MGTCSSIAYQGGVVKRRFKNGRALSTKCAPSFSGKKGGLALFKFFSDFFEKAISIFRKICYNGGKQESACQSMHGRFPDRRN